MLAILHVHDDCRLDAMLRMPLCRGHTRHLDFFRLHHRKCRLGYENSETQNKLLQTITFYYPLVNKQANRPIHSLLVESPEDKHKYVNLESRRYRMMGWCEMRTR